MPTNVARTAPPGERSIPREERRVWAPDTLAVTLIAFFIASAAAVAIAVIGEFPLLMLVGWIGLLLAVLVVIPRAVLGLLE